MDDPRTQEEGFSVGLVAEMTGLSTHALRYYERAGLVEPIARDAGGRRRYSAEEAEWVRFLVYLRKTGMPIRLMKRYAELRREGPRTLAERGELLEGHHREVKERLEELGRNLRMIEEKMRYCKDWEVGGGRSGEEA